MSFLFTRLRNKHIWRYFVTSSAFSSSFRVALPETPQIGSVIHTQINGTMMRLKINDVQYNCHEGGFFGKTIVLNVTPVS